MEMSEQDDDLQSRIRAVAEKAMQAYVQGILSSAALAEQIFREWELVRKEDEPPPHEVLVRIAQRICSRAYIQPGALETCLCATMLFII